MLRRLAEAKAGIEDDAIVPDAGGHGGHSTFGEKGFNFADHVAVVRGLLHGAWLALHVHQTDARLRCRDRFERALRP